MIITKHLPKKESLKKVIDSYYILYENENKVPYTIFPNTIKSILIGINTTFNYTNNNIIANFSKNDCSLCLLDNLQSNTFSINGASVIFQINFSSLGLCHFIKRSMTVLSVDMVVDDLFVKLKQVTEKHKNGTQENILQSIEYVLENAYQQKETEQLELAMQQLETSSTIKQVAIEANISYRTLNRYFEKYIGIKPSLFKRIYRFRKVLVDYDNNKLHMFYDESHLIREFKYFTGYTPCDFHKKLKNNNSDFYFEI
ncbi:AraC family transcriptional regulator [uncultured Algibacter sp.]|uniref:helix-turn-helix domain-containing protein n=1 Tax=uncultured Algibacter sp. TaxID=298659 RepID=UPI0032168C01